MTNLKKLYFKNESSKKIFSQSKSYSLKVWSRSLQIIDKFVGFRLKIHNGKEFIPLQITSEMVGHKLGEFVATRARYEFKKKKKNK